MHRINWERERERENKRKRPTSTESEETIKFALKYVLCCVINVKTQSCEYKNAHIKNTKNTAKSIQLICNDFCVSVKNGRKFISLFSESERTYGSYHTEKRKCIHSKSVFRFKEWNWAVKACIIRFDLICIAGQLFHHQQQRHYDTVRGQSYFVLCVSMLTVASNTKTKTKRDQSSVFFHAMLQACTVPTSPHHAVAVTPTQTPISIHLIIPFILLGRRCCFFFLPCSPSSAVLQHIPIFHCDLILHLNAFEHELCEWF